MKLSDICDVYSGYAFKTFNDLGHGVPVIKISNLLPDGSIDLINCLFTTENIKEKFYSKKSDIYIALSGATTGKISIMDKDNTFAINQRVGIVRNRSTISNEYLKYFLMSRSNRILEEASGCAQPNISPKQIANYDVPIYSDAVMNKIVSELREIDKIKNTYQKQLELLDELVKARFVEMFGDPIENQKDWEVVKIRDIVTDVRYGTSKPAVEGGRYPYLRMNNLTVDGGLDLSDLKYIDIPDNEIEKCVVRKGDILFNRTNSIDLIGKTAVFNLLDDMVIAGYIIRIRLNNQILPDVFSQYMNLEAMKKVLRGMAKGAVNQANINAQELQSIKVYIPDMELQKQYVEFKEEIDKSRSRIQKSLEASQELFDSLMQEYFG